MKVQLRRAKLGGLRNIFSIIVPVVSLRLIGKRGLTHRYHIKSFERCWGCVVVHRVNEQLVCIHYALNGCRPQTALSTCRFRVTPT